MKIKSPISILQSVLLGICIYSYLVLSSCGNDDAISIPKPQGYFRIDFPAKEYSRFRDSCPFSFEYPSNYAQVIPDNDKNAEPCWKNIVFHNFGAEVNLSYKQVNKNLDKFLDDSWTLATRHQIKASGMKETIIRRDSAKVYGLVFDIQGNSASFLQFYLTDSTHNFLRGALYFYARPNYDSLSPVTIFIRKDIEHMIATFQWEKEISPKAKN